MTGTVTAHPARPGVAGPGTAAAGVAAAIDAALLERVRRRLAAQSRPPTPAAVAAALRSEHRAPVGDVALLALAARIHAELVGAGPLAPFLADHEVTDVLVNGPDAVWVDRGHGLQRVACGLGDDRAVRRLAQRLAGACGRRLDDAQPFCDAQLPDGSRLHAVLPPVAADGVHLSLRTFRARAFTVDDLVVAGTLTAEARVLLRAVVRARLAFLVTGGTGSGKTTLLSTLLGEVPADERIVLAEDAAELRPVHPHVVSLVCRPANADGAGQITLRDLVRQALRMRPDRIVVGECRGAEVADLLATLNTGHEGGAGTLHANAPEDVPARLEALGALGGLSRAALHSQLASALQVVVPIRRGPSGRMVDQVCVVDPDEGGRVRVRAAWRRDGGPTPGRDALTALLARRGVAIAETGR